MGMLRWTRGAWLLLVCCCLLGCGEAKEGDGNAVRPARAPLMGAADSADGSDFQCQIVLVELGRRSDGLGGYVTREQTWVWFGTVDVSEALLGQGAQAAVLYHYGVDPQWWRVPAVEAVGGAAEGYQRFAFRMDTHLPTTGMSGTSLSRAVIEVIPVLELPGGLRLFDHNRNPGDFDNYILNASNGFKVEAELASCTDGHAASGAAVSELGLEGLPLGVLRFDAGWQVTQEGPMVEGGRLRVHYALERLPECRGTHNGYPAWDTRAFVRFMPGGEVYDGSLRAFVSDMGRPTTAYTAVAADFVIPLGAQQAELWFWNQSMGGSACQQWDSQFGENYVFPVAARPQWLGNTVLKVSRAGGHPCADGAALLGSFSYGTWARTRAVMANLCFEVYQAGVTDWENPEIWRHLDVQVHYRFDDGAFHSAYVDFLDFVGENGRFVFDISAVDPFRFYHCPDAEVVEVVVTETGQRQEVARMEFFFSVNGVALRPSTGAWRFLGEYWDDESPFRQSHCL